MNNIILITSIIILLVLVRMALPWLMDRILNGIHWDKTFTVSERAKNLHEKIFISDLHCDMLLWNRDFLKYNSHGHADLPRLIKGNTALQAFTIVSKLPLDAYANKSKGRYDIITFLAIAQGWPLKTWCSLKERALFQADKLKRFAELSSDWFRIIKSREELENFIEERKKNTQLVSGFMGIEGSHALEGKPENIDIFFDAGIRMLSLNHLNDNRFSGSAHSQEKPGLTAKGEQLIRRMEELGVLLDLSHSSPKAIEDVLKIIKKPAVASHTGAAGLCSNLRNLSDSHIRGIANTGGVIGVGYWSMAVCGKTIKDIVRTIKYVVRLTSINNAALGSDFDGSVSVPFDASGLAMLTEALLQEGFTEKEIELIMGGNTLRVLRQALP